MNVEKVAKHYSKLLDEDREEMADKIRKEALNVKNKSTIKELISSSIIQYIIISGGFVLLFKYGKNIPSMYEGENIQIKSLLAYAFVILILNMTASYALRQA